VLVRQFHGSHLNVVSSGNRAQQSEFHFFVVALTDAVRVSGGSKLVFCNHIPCNGKDL